MGDGVYIWIKLKNQHKPDNLVLVLVSKTLMMYGRKKKEISDPVAIFGNY